MRQLGGVPAGFFFSRRRQRAVSERLDSERFLFSRRRQRAVTAMQSDAAVKDEPLCTVHRFKALPL
jgi:hypothetical protein